MPTITSVRIVDPYVLDLIEAEQNRSGESTPTKTAQRMIIERARESKPDDEGSPQASVPPVASTA